MLLHEAHGRVAGLAERGAFAVGGARARLAKLSVVLVVGDKMGLAEGFLLAVSFHARVKSTKSSLAHRLH